MGLLKRLFGLGDTPGKPESRDQNGIVFYIKVHKCGAIARVRVDRNNDLSLDDDGESYVVRKQVMDNVCYGLAEMEVHYDTNRNETSRHVENGEFVTREDWEQQERLRIVPRS